MTRITQIKAFVTVAEEGGFTAAAKILGATQSAVSKSVADLEREVGVMLFHRSTRALRLSDVGEMYYTRMKALLQQWDDANQALASRQTGHVGRITVNSSNLLMPDLLVPAAVAFKKIHPLVEFDLIADDRRVDLVAGRADLMLRIGETDDSIFKTRRICTAPTGLFALKTYLLDHIAQTAIAYASGLRPMPGMDAALSEVTWEGRVFRTRCDTTIRGSNAGTWRALILNGYCAGTMPRFTLRHELARGEVVELSTTAPLTDMTISVIHPHVKSTPTRVAEFIEFLAAYCRETAYLKAA